MHGSSSEKGICLTHKCKNIKCQNGLISPSAYAAAVDGGYSPGERWGTKGDFQKVKGHGGKWPWAFISEVIFISFSLEKVNKSLPITSQTGS